MELGTHGQTSSYHPEGSEKDEEENIISRLRLGHKRLSKTLHVIGKRPSGLCECCEAEESVTCHCQKYITEREIFRRTPQEIL